LTRTHANGFELLWEIFLVLLGELGTSLLQMCGVRSDTA
jgi:hypothetical protein